MTWLGLHERTKEPRFAHLARKLVEQVHEVLAPRRPPDARHPAARGLRIGKPLAERAPHEPYDPQLEWDRESHTGSGAATRRLAFRELGHALAPLAEALEKFWLAPANQSASSWSAHLDINTVTLAASLAPEGALA